MGGSRRLKAAWARNNSELGVFPPISFAEQTLEYYASPRKADKMDHHFESHLISLHVAQYGCLNVSVLRKTHICTHWTNEIDLGTPRESDPLIGYFPNRDLAIGYE
jgi:hypothetical protein